MIFTFTSVSGYEASVTKQH